MSRDMFFFGTQKILILWEKNILEHSVIVMLRNLFRFGWVPVQYADVYAELAILPLKVRSSNFVAMAGFKSSIQ